MSRPFGHTIDMITFMIEQHAFKHLTANCNLATKHYSTWTSEMDKLCLSMFYFYLLLHFCVCFLLFYSHRQPTDEFSEWNATESRKFHYIYHFHGHSIYLLRSLEFACPSHSRAKEQGEAEAGRGKKRQGRAQQMKNSPHYHQRNENTFESER